MQPSLLRVRGEKPRVDFARTRVCGVCGGGGVGDGGAPGSRWAARARGKAALGRAGSRLADCFPHGRGCGITFQRHGRGGSLGSGEGRALPEWAHRMAHIVVEDARRVTPGRETGCEGAVEPRANGGSQQRGIWGRWGGGAAGTPVGKRDIEGETCRDIEPKQQCAERHGGRRRECCPTHRQKEMERRGPVSGF